MADKIALTNLSSLSDQGSAVSTINTNNSRIATAIDNALSRDGTQPNQMEAQLDMNSNAIINLPEPTSDQEPATKSYVDEAITGVLPDGGGSYTYDVASQAQAEAGSNNTTVMTPYRTAQQVDYKLNYFGLHDPRFWDVRRFGSNWDISSDPTTAIQTAIDAASDGITTTNGSPSTGPAFVRIPYGYWYTGQLTMKPFVILQGDGASATCLSPENGVNDHHIITPSFDTLDGTDVCLPSEGVINNIGLEHIRLHGNKTNQTAGRGLAWIAKNLYFHQAFVQDYYSDGVYTALGQQCPLNNWSIIVEGNVNGLYSYNNGGSGWVHRGPHDSFVNYYKAWLNGGYGLDMLDNSTSYRSTMDANHIHVYANGLRGINSVNVGLKVAFLRSENHEQEGIYLEDVENFAANYVSLLDNCRTSGSYQMVIDDDSSQTQVANLAIRRPGRDAAGGIYIGGGSNKINGIVSGALSNGSYSTGIGVDLAGGASNNSGNLVVEYFNGTGGIGFRTANSGANYWNNFNLQLNTNKKQMEVVTAGVKNRIIATGSSDASSTPYTGVAPATGANREDFDINLRTSVPTIHLSRQILTGTVNLNSTSEQTITISHNLVAAPPATQVHATLNYSGALTGWAVDYITVYSVSSSQIVLKVKLGTAAGSAGSATLNVHAWL